MVQPGVDRGLERGAQWAKLYGQERDRAEVDRVAAETQVESQRLEIARLQGQVEALQSVIRDFRGKE